MQFLTIPQKNSKKGEFNLVAIKQEEKINYDLTYNKEDDTWKIGLNFLGFMGEEEGYTAIISDDYSFLALVITNNTDFQKELSPKFLKGSGVSPVFKSNYFSKLVEMRGLESDNYFLNKRYLAELDCNVYELSLTKDEVVSVDVVDSTSTTKLDYDETVFEIKNSYNQAINTFEKNEVFS